MDTHSTDTDTPDKQNTSEPICTKCILLTQRCIRTRRKIKQMRKVPKIVLRVGVARPAEMDRATQTPMYRRLGHPNDAETQAAKGPYSPQLPVVSSSDRQMPSTSGYRRPGKAERKRHKAALDSFSKIDCFISSCTDTDTE